MHFLDDDALRTLLPMLRRFAYSLTRDSSSADDLVQASLERALSKWPSKRPNGDPKAWLFSILYRQFVDGRRKSVRWQALLAIFGARDETAPAADETFESRSSLIAFDRLAVDQRAVLALVSVEGLSYQETAQALGVPLGTVMSRLSRARQAYRRLMEGDVAVPALRSVK